MNREIAKHEAFAFSTETSLPGQIPSLYYEAASAIMYTALMQISRLSTLVLLCVGASLSVSAEDVAKQFRKAVERSTLDQPGMKPFHLRATLSPSLARDKGSNRTGTVEMWWESPTRWRREVTSPEFHQVEIVDGDRDWQKNDGDFFPEWLREMAVALVKPVPPLDVVLDKIRSADVRAMMGQLHASWVTVGTDGAVSKGIGAGIALNPSTGLLFYGSDVGWNFLYADYKDFHNRDIARKVSGGGTPEVTAIIETLESLPPEPANFFDTSQLGADTAQIHTEVVEELAIRKNLIAAEPFSWPPIENGPSEGVMITKVAIDREGKIRDVGAPVSDNPGLNDAARQQMAKMQFRPYLVDGKPVQVVTTITLPFKTARPGGTEAFKSARDYFELGRTIGFPASGSGAPYMLKAEFFTKGVSQIVDKGRYEDTWLSNTQWRREAWFGQSHIVKARNGETRYLLAEGPDQGLLKLLLKHLEPIPAIDTFIESDWRIKRETLDGTPMMRILTGYESPDGTLDPAHARGYWIDDQGRLVKTYFSGTEGRRSSFMPFDNFQIARRIDVLVKGTLGMRINVTDVSAPVNAALPDRFVVKGHQWTRQFTDEVR